MLEAAALLLELAGLNLLLLALLVLLLVLRLQSAALPLDALAQLRIQRFKCRGGIRQLHGAGLGDRPLELALPRQQCSESLAESGPGDGLGGLAQGGELLLEAPPLLLDRLRRFAVGDSELFRELPALVTATDPDPGTVWLALFWSADA